MPEPMNTSDRQAGDRISQVGKWLSLGGSIIAPATLITALLFYFGYVSSRAQFDYFGVDVDTIGLSTQDYVMRSPQPLLVPLLVLTLIGGGFLVAHIAARRRAAVDPSFRSLAKRMVVAGLILLGLGVILLFAYAVIDDWAYYPLVTPLILAVGGTFTAYGISTIRWMDKRAQSAPGHSAFAGPAVLLSIWLAVAASLFWATATVAQWSGRGLAKEQARSLSELPSVIVDSKQRLFIPSGIGVGERDLTGEADNQTFRYRYWNLRLLIHGQDRMFLVPATWHPNNTTLLIPLDGDVRVQFQFRNDPP
jgi:hypothetical protein